MAPAAMHVARPTVDLDRIRSFYEHVVGLPLLWGFSDHDGFDGVIFGVPDERAQLELVRSPHGDVPAPTGEDALVLYHQPSGGGPDLVDRLRRAGTVEDRGRRPDAEPLLAAPGRDRVRGSGRLPAHRRLDPRMTPPVLRRLEDAAGRNLADYVAALRRVAPELGAECIDIAGGVAAFTGIGSPLTTVKGVGPQLSPRDLDEIETFFRDRGATAVSIEIAPWPGGTAAEVLRQRGYGAADREDVVAAVAVPGRSGGSSRGGGDAAAGLGRRPGSNVRDARRLTDGRPHHRRRPPVGRPALRRPRGRPMDRVCAVGRLRGRGDLRQRRNAARGPATRGADGVDRRTSGCRASRRDRDGRGRAREWFGAKLPALRVPDRVRPVAIPDGPFGDDDGEWPGRSFLMS